MQTTVQPPLSLTGPGAPPQEINEIWSLLARTGTASRYLGQRSNGWHQVMLSHPTSGAPLAFGTGETPAAAMRAAVAELDACRQP